VVRTATPAAERDRGRRARQLGRVRGLSCREAKRRIVAWLQGRGSHSAGAVRLHDWCISRQRYWDHHPHHLLRRLRPVAVPERTSVELPFIQDFPPMRAGVSPLARHEEWYFVKCPRCGAQGRRETDVSDTFLDSAWYFLRYPSTEFDDGRGTRRAPRRGCRYRATSAATNTPCSTCSIPASSRCAARARQGALRRAVPEAPCPRADHQGRREDVQVACNVVIPDAYIQKWGADTLRMYLMFLGPFQEGGDFRTPASSACAAFSTNCGPQRTKPLH